MGLPVQLAAKSNPLTSLLEIGFSIFKGIGALFSWLGAREKQRAFELHQSNVKIYLTMLKQNPKEFQRLWNMAVVQYNTPQAGIYFSLSQAAASARMKQMSEAVALYKGGQ